jgi:hypothetical protein
MTVISPPGDAAASTSRSGKTSRRSTGNIGADTGEIGPAGSPPQTPKGVVPAEDVPPEDWIIMARQYREHGV